MTEQLHSLVERTIARGIGARVFPLSWKERRVWVKQAVPPKQKFWHRLQRLLASITGIPLLRPTVSLGGKDGLASEAKILRRLSEAGILVPKLLTVSDNWIVIGDNGRILQNAIEDEMRAGNRDRVVELITHAGQALAEFHAVGLSHGAPLLRNMTIREDGRIGFIDFEEDPCQRMAVSDAQARDILLFVFSIQRGFKKRPELLRAGWQAYAAVAGADAPQLKPLAKVVRLLWPVYLLLRPFRKWLGTDGVSALFAYRTLRCSLRGGRLPSSPAGAGALLRRLPDRDVGRFLMLLVAIG